MCLNFASLEFDLTFLTLLFLIETLGLQMVHNFFSLHLSLRALVGT